MSIGHIFIVPISNFVVTVFRDRATPLRSGGRELGKFLLALSLALLLEVMDFPDIRMTQTVQWFLHGMWTSWPGNSVHNTRYVSCEFFRGDLGYGVLDAHALWHAATMIITPLWYSFVLQDAASAVSSKANGQILDMTLSTSAAVGSARISARRSARIRRRTVSRSPSQTR